MLGKMKIMYLISCFSMVFDSKFKINLHHEHFPETLEKYTRFPKFTLLFSIVMYISMERLYADKFPTAFYGV